MAYSEEEHLETTLLSLDDLTLSRLTQLSAHQEFPAALRQSLILLMERLDGEQDPLNSFQASI